MLAPSLPITTERLRLRPLGEEDAGTLHAMESREDVARWLY
jgi:RimJ/RimL family protein N-acetyltransferase